jgi:CDP-glycerol glycerophosphotransferase (TagB/SpsB family)
MLDVQMVFHINRRGVNYTIINKSGKLRALSRELRDFSLQFSYCVEKTHATVSQLIARSSWLITQSSQLIFEYVSDKIVVLIKRRKIIMPASLYSDKGDHPGVDLLQCLAVPDRYQPVFGAVQDISVTFYFG